MIKREAIALFCLSLLLFASGCATPDGKHHLILAWMPEIDPTNDAVVTGVALGVANNLGDRDRTVVNGINAEIMGLGILFPLSPYDPGRDYYRLPIDSPSIRQDMPVVYGIDISPGGTFFRGDVLGISVCGMASGKNRVTGIALHGIYSFTEDMTGLQVSAWSANHRMSGIQIGIWNRSARLRGVQVGLINQSLQAKGLQLGLWNRNGRRGLPIINWDFSATTSTRHPPRNPQYTRRVTADYFLKLVEGAEAVSPDQFLGQTIEYRDQYVYLTRPPYRGNSQSFHTAIEGLSPYQLGILKKISAGGTTTKSTLSFEGAPSNER